MLKRKSSNSSLFKKLYPKSHSIPWIINFFFTFILINLKTVWVARDIPLHEQRILFTRVSQGDVMAFRVLFDSYRTRLYYAVRKLTKSPYAAEEIVQEIFTNLWMSRTNLAAVEHPANYIFTIAYHQSFRYLKKMAVEAERQKSFLISASRLTRNPKNGWNLKKCARSSTILSMNCRPKEDLFINSAERKAWAISRSRNSSTFRLWR